MASPNITNPNAITKYPKPTGVIHCHKANITIQSVRAEAEAQLLPAACVRPHCAYRVVEDDGAGTVDFTIG